MEQPVVRLEDFGLTDLQVHWEPGAESAEEPAESALSVGYRVEWLDRDPSKGRLTLIVRDRRGSSETNHMMDIAATAVAFIKFPEHMSAEDRERVARINGLTLLWGSLRGALLAVGGIMGPGSRYMLPTVNMLEIIKSAEGSTTEPGVGEAMIAYGSPEAAEQSGGEAIEE